ncbi:MAG: ATP-binding protein [Bacteroidota bacterium]
MEHITKKEIIAATQAYMQEHNMKPADVSKKTGVNSGYLSKMLEPNSNFMYSAGAGKEGFISVKHFLALAELCGYQTEKVYWQTQPTAQTNAILAHLQEAKEHSQTIVMIGETGAGKSFTSNIFASKNPIDTFIVTAGSSDSLGDLITKMVEKLGVNVPFASKSEKIQAIADRMKRLTHLNHKPMLMIDEAEYLKQTALCAVKEIYDYINPYCSIVLIGTDQLKTNIETLRKRNKPGIPQFHRRIKFGLRVLPSIDREFTMFVSDIEDKDLKKFLLKNCNNYGELHDLLVPAMREAERLGAALTMALVRKMLNLPDGDLAW